MSVLRYRGAVVVCAVADAQTIDHTEKIKNSSSVLRGDEKKGFLGTRRLAAV